MKCRSVAILAVTALLAACAGSPEGSGFRDTSQPLSVTTRGGAAEMHGQWFVRAHYPGEENLARVRFLTGTQSATGIELVRQGCRANGDCDVEGELWETKPLGLNRWRITSPHRSEARELWVIWVDEGFRTAAIGAPDGSYGWILDRAANGGEDRIFAAQEILDFNGYDTSALVMR